MPLNINKVIVMILNTTEEIIEDIRQGKMVVIMDDEDRENEGDLLMASSAVTADDVNFMARYGRGLICMTLTPQRCQQLNLPLMIHGTDGRQLLPDGRSVPRRIPSLNNGLPHPGLPTSERCLRPWMTTDFSPTRCRRSYRSCRSGRCDSS